MNNIILEGVVGSTLHGTAVNDGLEDLDLMAVAVEDQKTFMGFSPRDVWVERTKPQGVRSEAGDIDRTVYGLRKYLSLAVKGNPTILLVLFLPSAYTRIMTPHGSQLQGLAPLIVSKACYGPFRGYMRQQKERLIGTRGQKNCTRPELVEKYGYDTKYAGHIVRLGLQGTELLTTGRLTLPMKAEDRQMCVDVRNGVHSFEDVVTIIGRMEELLDVAYKVSPLPETPNSLAVETWMLSVYRQHWLQM